MENCRALLRGGTPNNGLHGEAPPERGTFFTLQVYERVGISTSRNIIFRCLKGPVIKVFRTQCCYDTVVMTSCFSNLFTRRVFLSMFVKGELFSSGKYATWLPIVNGRCSLLPKIVYKRVKDQTSGRGLPELIF